VFVAERRQGERSRMRRVHSILQRELRSLINRAVDDSKRGKEIVGLMVDNGYYLELVMCRNKSRRSGSFSFFHDDVRSVVAAAKCLGHEVVGTFHSHPAALAEPADSDIASAPNDSLMLIVDCLAHDVALWRIKDNQARKLPLHELTDVTKARRWANQ
jgi:proteasome lid subunit RPN8/RPN11